jgi:hypothetical protein
MIDYRQNLLGLIKDLIFETPSDLKLRFLYADHLMEFGLLEDSEREFNSILSQSDHMLSKAGLARIHFLNGNFRKCIEILDEIKSYGWIDANVLLLYAKALLRQNLVFEACVEYRKVTGKEPLFYDAELESVKNACL